MGLLIGAALPRVEDERLLAGDGRYVADVRVGGCLEAAFVRSPVAHGVLSGVGTARAAGLPGVAGVWTGAELPASLVVPAVAPELTGGHVWPALAGARVRFVGEAVAVVLARDRYLAEDAVDEVEVTIAPLPVVVDPAEGEVVVVRAFGAPIDDAVWREALVVVEAEYRHPRLVPTSLEARAILVVPEDGELSVWCSHQAPHRLRDHLAQALGMAAERVRVRVPDVGGAFGGKSQTFPEYLVVAHLARALGRPVRWIEDRREAMVAATHGRGGRHRVRLAADRDGGLRALRVDIDGDVGAYPHFGAVVPVVTSMMATGAYAIPRVEVRTRIVTTNTTPTAPYRGAGRPEAAYSIERTMDLLAVRLGADPAELRRRNFIRDFPYQTPTGFRYDSGDHAAALDRALAAIDYHGWRAEQRERATTGDGPPLGIGIACYVERSGTREEYGGVVANADGTVTALSGCCSTGQGHRTTFPQVVADVLGIDAALVDLVEADTAVVPRGVGSFASRSMQIGGAALHRAATGLIAEARRRAAELLGVPVEATSYAKGRVVTSGAVISSAGFSSVEFSLAEFSLAELAARTGELRAEDVFEPPEAFPFGCHVAVVEVDPELGDVRVVRMVAVDDCGVVVNPLVVRGQSQGSVTQGLGQALYEAQPYDGMGRPEAETLLDYLLPTLSEVPPVTYDETCTPNPNTPLGAKGSGEAGCIGTPPAIVNAVADALGGDVPLSMPLTPRTCWAARESARGSAA